jgi:hypothetical protein
MFSLAEHEKFTYEHYCLLPEGDRRELIEGELLVTPATSEQHQRFSGNLEYELRKFLEERPLQDHEDFLFRVYNPILGYPKSVIDVPLVNQIPRRCSRTQYFDHKIRTPAQTFVSDPMTVLFQYEHNVGLYDIVLV